MVRRRLCAARAREAYLIGVGVSELHINHPPGAARRYQERVFRQVITGLLNFRFELLAAISFTQPAGMYRRPCEWDAGISRLPVPEVVEHPAFCLRSRGIDESIDLYRNRSY